MPYKISNKIISVLLILIFVIMLIPSIAPGFEGGDAANKSQDLIAIYNFNNHTKILVQDGRKLSPHLLTAKAYWFVEHNAINQDYSNQCFNQKGIVLDVQQKIKKLISHYFHGSKYKDTYRHI